MFNSILWGEDFFIRYAPLTDKKIYSRFHCLNYKTFMNAIPITFTHRGKTYSGSFSRVSGAGSTSVWHLHDEKGYYLGRLRIGFNGDWYFDGKDELEFKAREFGMWVSEHL